jgi:hypothetical protein
MDEGARVDRLKGDILHFSVDSREHHESMIEERYAPLGAQKMFDDGRRTSPLKALLSSWFAFVRGYFLKLGFLDGVPGFYIAYYAARHTLLKHRLLLKLQTENG